ncbi:hypothetical protein MBENS4_3403 [Novosphingobium sp. MBES04]|nr:hypothetical protein MBENS4_3403 [Novosphingobium sp. MBES04]
MSSETAFISALRNLASSTAARGLMDDAAVLNVGGADLVLTMDTVVESVHFLPDDPAQDVAWKLVAVNASDLSAKGLPRSAASIRTRWARTPGTPPSWRGWPRPAAILRCRCWAETPYACPKARRAASH